MPRGNPTPPPPEGGVGGGGLRLGASLSLEAGLRKLGSPLLPLPGRNLFDVVSWSGLDFSLTSPPTLISLEHVSSHIQNKVRSTRLKNRGVTQDNLSSEIVDDGLIDNFASRRVAIYL